MELTSQIQLLLSSFPRNCTNVGTIGSVQLLNVVLECTQSFDVFIMTVDARIEFVDALVPGLILRGVCEHVLYGFQFHTIIGWQQSICHPRI